VRPQTQLHQTLGFGEARNGESLIDLIVLHGAARLVVPSAQRLLMQVTCLRQRTLNFLDAFGLQAELRPAPP
jgi:hypothetical protein